MKKLLVTILMTAALATSVFAQGTVAFSASAAHGLVQYTTDGTTRTSVPVGNPAQVGAFGNLNIAIYSAAVGTANPFTAGSFAPLPAAWSESTTVLHQIAPLAGNTPAFTFTLGNIAGGVNGEIMVLGWTGAASDWNSALAAGTGLFGWTGSTLSTGALSFTAATGNPPILPAVPITYGAAGFNGLVLAPIPEPTSFALAGLGLAALLVFRRRN